MTTTEPTETRNREQRRHPRSETAETIAADPLAGKLLLTVPEAQNILSVPRTRIYSMIESGELGSVKLGRRRMIPTDAIRALLADLSAA